ncbi:MAG: glycosyltransferase family 1 protein, partial [Patescibacteria group bacterium]
EVVGDAGILCDPHEPASIAVAITKVLADVSLYQTIRGNTLAQAKKFSWQETASRTMEVYKSVTK